MARELEFTVCWSLVSCYCALSAVHYPRQFQHCRIRQSRRCSNWYALAESLVRFIHHFKLGQFPFLIHEERTIPTFALITKYVAELKDVGAANLDASLNNSEKSRKVAWCAHVESNLGDLVVNPHSLNVSWRLTLILKHHTLYSHHGNWTGLTQPALASMLPVPQCYYVPGRIRECHRARLEAAGLWNLPEVEKQEKRPFKEPSKSVKEKVDSRIYLQAFEREKVCKLPFHAISRSHLVSGVGESTSFNGHLYAPSWE
jgi:hypothetical protein